MRWPQDTTADTATSPQGRERDQSGRRAPAAARLLLAPLALLAACATPGPATERAALLTAATLAPAEQKSTEKTSIEASTEAATEASLVPAPDWWRALGDAQLNTLMDEALAGAQDPLAAQARLRQAQALAGLADARQSPSVSASAGWTAEHPASLAVPASQGGGQLTRQWRGTVGVDWTPDLWGGQNAEWQAALGDVRAAELSAQEARIQLSVALVQAYLQLAYAHVQGDIAQAEFDRVTDVRRLTLQRLDSGLATQAQLRQTDSDLASAAQQQLQARRRVVAAQHALSTLAGQGPGRGERLTRPAWPGSAPSPWSAAPSPRAEVPSLPSGLLDRRTDVLAARWRVEAAGERIHVARTAFQPQLNLGALAGLAASRGGDLLRSGAGTYSASLGLTLPLLDGGRRRAGLALQEAQYDEAVAHYNQTLIRAVNEVTDQLQAQRSLAEQLEQQQRAREAADEAWQLAQQRYTAGVGSYLDALSVRQQLLVAEQRLAALQSQRLQDGLDLVRALGGGFQPAEPPQP